MDKRSLLAIVLSLIILIGYQELISYLYPPQPAPEQARQSQRDQQNPQDPMAQPSQPPTASPASTGPPPSVRAPAPVGQPEVAEIAEVAEVQEISVETSAYSAVFTSHGARLKSFRLKDYPGDTGKDSPPREMIRQGVDGQLPLEVRLEGNTSGIDDSQVYYAVEGGNLELDGDGQATRTFRGTLPNGSPIAKEFTFSGQGYGMQLRVHIEQAGRASQTASALSLVWTKANDPSQADNYYSTYGPVALLGRKFIYEAAASLEEATSIGPGQVRWAGHTDSYFLSAMMPPKGDHYTCIFNVVNGTARTSLTTPWNGQAVILYALCRPQRDVCA